LHFPINQEMKLQQHRTLYILVDVFAGIIGWTLFFIYRKKCIESGIYGHDVPLHFNERYFIAIFTLPFFWVILHYLSGYYKEVMRKSRLMELWQTFITSLIGTIILFYLLLLDDYIPNYQTYYQLSLSLFLLQFCCTYFPRVTITSLKASLIQRGLLSFNTLIVGSDQRAKDLTDKLKNQKKRTGNQLIGFVQINGDQEMLLQEELPLLGRLSNLESLIKEKEVSEVIIALEPSEHDKLVAIINELHGCAVTIKAIPSMYDILSGKVKMTQIYNTPLIELSHRLMPTWQIHTKQAIDYMSALLALLFLSPLFLVIATGIKLTSKGPVIFTNERIGKFGRPFTLYKFRSMYVDAEKNGPALSSKNDKRITPFGKFLRKTKLDELPNFINVLKGDMSLVGPRPERQFFIDKIIRVAPHYLHLQKVKPGITSWGQVKFGYAESVEEMVERLKYDLLYIENMSLYIDFKIMIYTLIIVFRGRHI